jgi:hypothetical protein
MPIELCHLGQSRNVYIINIIDEEVERDNNKAELRYNSDYDYKMLMA